MNVDEERALYREFFKHIVQNNYFAFKGFENITTLSSIKDKYGFTLLHRASSNNRDKIASFLIENGSNLEAKATDSWTPLHLACVSSSQQCVEVLISAGSNLNVIDTKGNTPLHLSVIGRNKDIVRALVNAEASRSVKNINGLTPYNKAAELELNYLMDVLV